MVHFHDRRNKTYDLDEVTPRLDLAPGDTVGKNLVDGRYVVRGTTNDEGHRDFVIHEVLPNGKVIERGRTDRRTRAKEEASRLAPTSVYEI